MHQYLVNPQHNQPPAYVNQMPPASNGAVDPKMVKQALEQIQNSQNVPMSANDGINITISIEPQDQTLRNYPDVYIDQAERFSKTPLARSYYERPEVEIDMNDKSRQVTCAASKMLQDAISQQMHPGAMVIEEHYVPFMGVQRRPR